MKKTFFKYLGVILFSLSIIIGIMLDCNFFDKNKSEIPVITSFLLFLLAVTFLCYSDKEN